jgi:hypothetical protein
MNKGELEILKIGFNAGKKAIEMHPENDEYDTIRFNEAQELVKYLDISLVSNRTFIMNQFELKSQFTEEFFEEFQFDAEFRSIFESMTRGLTPYEAIEHLCKSKKELFQSLERAIENAPTKIIVTTERFEQLKDEIKQ